MSQAMWHGDNSRKIVKRIVVAGDLVLQTPAHFGSGDEAGALIPLIVDEREQKPLLTGASIAGALRSYLWSLERGYGTPTDAKNGRGSLTAALFGGVREDAEGEQSRLIVDDAIGENGGVELRDGVKINPKSRTAEAGKLYSFVVWRAGTRFPLRFELIICESDNEVRLKEGLAAALSGLQHGEIGLGARKVRGYGRATVDSWQVRIYDMRNKSDLVAWLRDDLNGAQKTSKLHEVLQVAPLCDKRRVFTLEAQFMLRSTLLIRADSAVADMGHLRSNGKSVLSGTSLAGAIRARALKIANTLGIANAKERIDKLFGRFGEEKDQARSGSRITFEEHTIQNGQFGMVQSRVSIDRFTGGALDTALFSQQPQIGGTVTLKCRIKNPEDHEIGLLLLILKDLWTGDLPLGGESSVGRGRLLGTKATIKYNGAEWTIESAGDGKLSITGDRKQLERYVQAIKVVAT
ncbi:MAG: RAMP superfamily CRISPR-associated protein [Anaerolineae bacterium]|nr:RAMP superfamily CRISPR-associated protein [Anaerolineae bacterium]